MKIVAVEGIIVMLPLHEFISLVQPVSDVAKCTLTVNWESYG